MKKFDMPPERGIFGPRWRGWKENTFYEVWVSFSKDDPIHKALFFSGLLKGTKQWPGMYHCLFHPIYNQTYKIRDVYFMQVIKKVNLCLD